MLIAGCCGEWISVSIQEIVISGGVIVRGQIGMGIFDPIRIESCDFAPGAGVFLPYIGNIDGVQMPLSRKIRIVGQGRVDLDDRRLGGNAATPVGDRILKASVAYVARIGGKDDIAIAVDICLSMFSKIGGSSVYSGDGKRVAVQVIGPGQQIG